MLHDWNKSKIIKEPASSFCLENAREVIGTTFNRIEEKIVKNALVFYDVQPIADYILSMIPFFDIPEDVVLYTEMKDWLTQEARKKLFQLGGTWTDPKEVGFYLCKNR
jgi:hypothetical protein